MLPTDRQDAVTNSKFNSPSSPLLNLPNELYIWIMYPLSLQDLLSLRLSCKDLHALVSCNESDIVRYHVSHTLPKLGLELYPLPIREKHKLRHLRPLLLHLDDAKRQASFLFDHLLDESALMGGPERTEELGQRLKRELIPALLVLGHFFDQFRNLHVQHLLSGGIPPEEQEERMTQLTEMLLEEYEIEMLFDFLEHLPRIASVLNERLCLAFRSKNRHRVAHSWERVPNQIVSEVLYVSGLSKTCELAAIDDFNTRRAAVDAWFLSLPVRDFRGNANEFLFDVPDPVFIWKNTAMAELRARGIHKRTYETWPRAYDYLDSKAWAGLLGSAPDDALAREVGEDTISRGFWGPLRETFSLARDMFVRKANRLPKT